MKRLFSLLLIALMAILVACGGAETTDDASAESDNEAVVESDSDSSSDADFPITYTVAGAFEATGASNGMFFCDDGDGVFEQFYEISFFNDSQQFDLSVMDGVSGTVDLIGSDDDGANPGAANYVDFRDSDGNNYELGSGTLTIDSFPSAAGETFAGNLVAELSDDEGDTINLDVTFDLTVGSSAFEDCPE